MSWLSNYFSKESASARQSTRLAKQEARIGLKGLKDNNKADRFISAYSNGIDPQAAKWNGISNVTSSVTTAASNIWGFGFSPGDRKDNSNAYKGTGILGASNGLPTHVVLLVALLLIAMVGGLFKSN